MPFVIYGTRGLTSTISDGEFYCPQCDHENSRYTLKGVRTWFTMYFIPIFPVSGSSKYVECRRCGGTFKEEVLDMEPPTPADRLASGVGEALNQGMSLREAEQQVTGMGIPAEKAGEFVREIAGEKRWTCPVCGDEYLSKVRKCRTCNGSPSRR